MSELPIHPSQNPAMSGPGTLPVSESFVSIQGEGKLTGVPSWFLRVAGCNLRCRWCDTPYASWSPDSVLRSIDDIAEEGRRSGVRHAVLTGGEPMIFAQLVPLTDALRGMGMHITIETAGTVTLAGVRCDLMSISPKLANSTPAGDPRDPGGAWARRHDDRRFNPAALNELISSSPAIQVKFVVTAPEDLREIDSMLSALEGLQPDDVVLMPEGVTVPDPAAVAWVVDACQRRGWRYGDRLHIRLFGDTRGT
ncbi:MAG: 7-carboxy-7-deazaguanine synthase QueE [Planctomycetota bacterium]